ncbi:MAG: hypothetical protein J6V44_08770 [Methanobrevibacter sp.]|nr:hypothetical protein [Methanobrevibacter sp.]
MSNDDVMIDFSEFDAKINNEQFKNDLKEAQENSGKAEFKEVPAGEFIVTVEKLELGATKAEKYPLFTCWCRIVEGDFNNSLIFFNRKLYGNRETDKWNDAKAIQTVVTWLDELGTETVPVFNSYSDFKNIVLDIFTEISEDKLKLKVKYDPDAFNSITILDVIEPN